jgi:predicted nucleic acid binding AN1-type Zn finger protein
MKKVSAFQAPLHPLENEKRTFGCRYSNPDFCAKNRLPQVCALVRSDKLCYAPPHLWPKQFKKLQGQRELQTPKSAPASIPSI